MDTNFLEAEAAISAQLAAVRSEKAERGGTIYNRIVQILLYATVALMPLFYLPWTSSVLDFNKQMLLVVSASVGLVVWLLGVVVSGRLTIRTSPVDKGVFAVLVATAVATVFSLTRAKSIFGLSISSSSAFLSILAFSVLYFLAVNTLHDRGRMLRNALSVSAVLALVLGVMQMFTWYILPGGFTHSRAFNTVGSLNALGVLAAIILPMFAKTSMKSGNRVVMIAGIAGVVLSILTLGILNWWVLWAIALAGMLAMIAFDSMNVTQLAQDYSGRAKRFALSRFIIPMTVIVLGGFLLLVGFNPTALKSNFPVEVAPSHRLSFDVVVGVMKDRMLFGYGPENFSLAFDKFGADSLANSQLSNFRFFDGSSEALTAVVHGGALMVLALVLLLWSLVQVAARFGGAISESVSRGEGAVFAAESAGTLAALAAATAAFFLYPFNMTLMAVWYVLLVLAALTIAGERSKTVDIEERPMYSLSASLGFIVGLIAVLTGVYFITVMYIADARYASAAKASTPVQVMDGIMRAVNLDGTNDRYLRDASQTALNLLRAEVNKKDADPERAGRIQNLMASAVQLAQRATEVAPLESLNWNNLGVVYQSMTGLVENVEQLAEAAFAKASELRPGDPGFDNQTGQMWLARADLIRQVARGATGANASQLAAQFTESLAKAEAAFKRALEKSPNFGLAIYNLGAVYERQNKVNEAIKQLEKILPANANEPTLIFEIGLLYIRSGQRDNALAAMQRAVLLAPQYANARWYLALLLEERKDIDGALAQLREIQKTNPDNEDLNRKIAELEAGRVSIPPARVIDSEPIE